MKGLVVGELQIYSYTWVGYGQIEAVEALALAVVGTRLWQVFTIDYMDYSFAGCSKYVVLPMDTGTMIWNRKAALLLQLFSHGECTYILPLQVQRARAWGDEEGCK